jgi:hypothetical protein
MSYLGNQPGVGSFIVSTERFNGTGACTQFTITQTGIQDANVVDIIVSNVPQDPINSYSIANGVITFTEAPPSGTQNIIVRYRATTVITYGSVDGATILAGTITSAKLASGVIVPSATANAAAGYANSAFATANSSSSYANSAFLQANTPSNVANSAASYANSGFTTANSAGVYANSAYNVANGAASVANTDYTTLSFTAGVYGNAVSIPALTISANGRITAVTNTAVSGVDAHPFLFTAMGS